MLTEWQRADEAVHEVLAGSVLEGVRVYGAVALLGFNRAARDGDSAQEAWVTFSGELDVVGPGELREGCTSGLATPLSSNALRAIALARVILLIGGTVLAAGVSDEGDLSLTIGDQIVIVRPTGEILEEVWSVMTDSPSPGDAHRVLVALDDAGQLAVSRPA